MSSRLPSHRQPIRLWSSRSGVVVASLAALAVTVTLSTGGVFENDSTTVPQVVALPSAPAVTTDVFEETLEVDVEAVAANAKAKAAQPVPDLSKMTLDQLQAYSAKMQAEFVTASLAYEQSRTQVAQAQVAADTAQSASEDADEDATRARDAYANQITSTYQSGIVSNPLVRAMSGGEDSISEMMENMAVVQQVNDATGDIVEDMDAARVRATKAAETAQRLEDKAAQAEQDAEGLLSNIQSRAAQVAAAAGEALADANGSGPLFASAEQKARNDAARTQWKAYKLEMRAALARKGLAIPWAARLTERGRFPKTLDRLVDDQGRRVPGMAVVRLRKKTVTVLPRETVAAVDVAFRAVGKPYVAGNEGPETYDCSGLTASVWPRPYSFTGVSPANQLASTTKVRPATMQVGDLAFFTAPGDGVQHVGLNLGGNLVVTADASRQQVGVQQVTGDVFAATRPTLPRKGKNSVPVSTADAVTRCGGAEVPDSPNAMVWPIPEDGFSFSATFGEAGSLWSSGYHTGLDFSAPIGTPVKAAKAGTVIVEASSWAGPQHVLIDHGDGLQTTYAHMSTALVTTGDHVVAGQVIGAVGVEGNVTGPHLHFEVVVQGVKVDPMLFLSGGGGSGSWGGFSNGMIPVSALCPLTGAPGHALRCDAASAWNAMAAAYKRDLGSALCITDSYRTYQSQVTLYGQKPSLAAIPGTSNHGWAMATDLCGGIESWGTREHEWMVANAPKFGWIHPDWAVQGGGREEPWHWEFGEIS